MRMTLNAAAMAHAKGLIQRGKINNAPDQWGEHRPDAGEEDGFLHQHEIANYDHWHLGLDPSKDKTTKGHYTFPIGDFKTVHRAGLLAAKKRAAQQGYRVIEKAADELLHLLEKKG